jgi:O-antigen/teichoic acid export membrane protein
VVHGLRISDLWWGLFWGDVLSRIFACCFLGAKRFKRFIRVFNKPLHFPKLIEVMKGNRDFILYSFPSNLLSSLTSQLPVFFTGFCFGPEYVGFLGFATSLLYIPLNILGNSIYTVFYQRIAKLSPENVDHIGALTSKVGSAVWIMGIAPFAALIGFGDLLFGWFLGENWIEAGQLARYMGFYYFIFLVYISMSAVFTVLGKQQYLLIVQVLRGLIIIAAFGIGYYLDNARLTFLLFGIVGSIPYLIALIVLYRKLNLSLSGLAINLLVVAAAIGLVFGIRTML